MMHYEGGLRYDGVRRHPPIPPLQVLTTLGFLLEPISHPMEPLSRWYKLTRKRATDRVSGEICLVAFVVPKYVHVRRACTS